MFERIPVEAGTQVVLFLKCKVTRNKNCVVRGGVGGGLHGWEKCLSPSNAHQMPAISLNHGGTPQSQNGIHLRAFLLLLATLHCKQKPCYGPQIRHCYDCIVHGMES